MKFPTFSRAIALLSMMAITIPAYGITEQQKPVSSEPLIDRRAAKEAYRDQIIAELNRIDALELTPIERIRQIDEVVNENRVLLERSQDRQFSPQVDLVAVSDQRMAKYSQMTPEDQQRALLFREYSKIVSQATTPEERIAAVDAFIAKNSNKAGNAKSELERMHPIVTGRPNDSEMRQQINSIHNQQLSPEEHIRQVDAYIAIKKQH